MKNTKVVVFIALGTESRHLLKGLFISQKGIVEG